jgi:hypothetical protein
MSDISFAERRRADRHSIERRVKLLAESDRTDTHHDAVTVDVGTLGARVAAVIGWKHTRPPLTSSMTDRVLPEAVLLFMLVAAAEVARQNFPRTLPFAFEASETFDLGSDTGTGVDDDDYQPPFALNGKLNKLTLRLGPSDLSAAEWQAVKESAIKGD